ncbi:MAG: phosphonopyruvate decarboxylase [Gammaproteobacteria bacterium]|jgi:phosphonopyruvate decarboxylase
MISAHEFVDRARDLGFTWYAGLPCSFLTPFINYVIGDPSLTYVSAANEGDAVATIAGAVIGGRGGVAMMQNSGLGNAVSPLTSLAYVFRIPMLIICTHRGAPGLADEPQHELMGEITGQLFDTMRIPWEYFPTSGDEISASLTRATDYFAEHQRPYALVMPKGAVAPHELESPGTPERNRAIAINGPAFRADSLKALPSRTAALQMIIDSTPISDSVVLATTGFTGRELYAAADRDNHFYMVGSMGCASSLGVGLALARPDLQVVVVDGDGAALMRMGNMATVGAYAGGNLTHILLDNEAHDSTGAQATVSTNVDFASIALACGYACVHRSRDIDGLESFLKSRTNNGPQFLHLKIKTGTIENLPRPSITPAAVLERLKQHISQS